MRGAALAARQNEPMTDDLAARLGRQESACLEFKQSAADRDALRRAICALANDLCRQGGGDLLIGVDKHGNAVADVDVSDQALCALTDLRDDGRILDRPSLTVQVERFQERPIVRIHVEASATPPVRFDGRVWVRPGPTTRKASPEDERVLAERRLAAAVPFDSQPCQQATVDDLDLGAFGSNYLPAMVSMEVREENGRPVGQQLAALDLTDASGHPTVLGVLVLGYAPTSFLPGAYVQFARFDGVGMESVIIDEKEFRDNVLTMATPLEATLASHLRTAIVEKGPFQERPQPDYPIAALREVCMNALMHRNYQSSYAPVRILWFHDRIEVSNPGGPFGQVNEENFDRVNDYRNPSLASAMKALGYVNRFGRGVGRIRAAMQTNGNPPPEFRVDRSSWSVTLRSAK